MTAGLLAKTALFPLHLWLPPAHANAPAPASAVLSGLVVKGSFFLTVRLWFYVLPALPVIGFDAVLGALGSAAVVFGSVLALRQPRLKLLIAYSTVAQIGYLFLIFPLGSGTHAWTADGWNGGVMQVLAHAFAKAAMFLAAGLIYESLGHDRIAKFSGAARAMPMTFLTLGLGGLSLMGLPPSGGFAAKWLYLRASVASGQWAWALVLLVGRPARRRLRLPDPRACALARAGSVEGAAAANGRSDRAGARRRRGGARLRAGVLLPASRHRAPYARDGGSAMTGVGPILLAATLAVPTAFFVACFFPRLRADTLALQWLAPIPAFVAAVAALVGGPFDFEAPALKLSLRLDLPAALLLGVSALLWIAVGAGAFVERSERPEPRAALCWLLTLIGSLGVFVADDLLSFYLVYALVSIPAYGMFAFDASPETQRAGNVYMAFALLGEAFLLFAFGMLAAGEPHGSLRIPDVVAALPGSPWRDAALLLLVAGFGAKMGLVPLNGWMPLSYAATPIPAAAVLSGAGVKAGVIGLVRFLPLGTALGGWGEALAAVGFVTAFYGVLIGVTQQNPKAVLAYSSVSQMGVVAAAVGMALSAGDPNAPALVAFYAANHVLVKGALFLTVGAFAARKVRPTAWWLLAVALALSLAGLPFTGGALAKAASKPLFGFAAASGLAAASSAGSAMLMLHFVSRLPDSWRFDSTGRRAPLVRFWPAAAICALVLPYLLFPFVGDFAQALSLPNLWDGLWPILVGGALALWLARAANRLPRIPAGDTIVFAEAAFDRVLASGALFDRADAAFRSWPAAGLALLAITLALIFATDVPPYVWTIFGFILLEPGGFAPGPYEGAASGDFPAAMPPPVRSPFFAVGAMLDGVLSAKRPQDRRLRRQRAHEQMRPFGARGASADLPPVPQEGVRQHAGDHRLADRDRPDSDTGVVAAPGRDLRVLHGPGHSEPRGQDRRRRLDGEARDDRLAGRNAAQNAAGVVGEEAWPAVVSGAHLVGVVLAGEFGGGEAVADLDALDRVDAHEGAGELRVELAVDRRAPAGRRALGDDLDHRADRRARPADGVEIVDEAPDRLGVRAEERISAHLVPAPVRPVDLELAELHERAADRDPGDDLAGDGAGGDPRGGLARRRPPAAAIVADAVFGVVGVVGVAGPVLVPDLAVVLRALVDVLDEHGDRGSGRHLPAGLVVRHDARENARLVRLPPLGGEARRPGPAAVELGLDVGRLERQTRRAAVDDAADPRPVALAESGDAEQVAEGVVRHGPAHNGPSRAPSNRRDGTAPRETSRAPRNGIPPGCEAVRSRLGLVREKAMLKTFAAAGLAAALALASPAGFAQTDAAPMPDKAMSGDAMAPKKPMTKHHTMHKKTMTKTNMKSDTMNGGETQRKM